MTEQKIKTERGTKTSRKLERIVVSQSTNLESEQIKLSIVEILKSIRKNGLDISNLQNLELDINKTSRLATNIDIKHHLYRLFSQIDNSIQK